MPKIISADRDLIIDITRKLIEEERYDEINCRSIANKAGIAVGTLYHFFKTKMDIIAYIIYEDWSKVLSSIQVETSIEEGVKNIYNSIFCFSSRYYRFWHNTKDVSSEYISHIDKHSILVKQVDELLVRLLNYNSKAVDFDLINFVSETIIYHSSKLDEYQHYGKYMIKLLEGE